MDQLENNSIEQDLRSIFENEEIYVTLSQEYKSQEFPAFGLNQTPTTFLTQKTNMLLVVKQRQKDFVTGKESWNDALFMQLAHPYLIFNSRDQSFNQFDNGIVSRYNFDVYDLESFTTNVNKYMQELFDKRFTKALESKLTED